MKKWIIGLLGLFGAILLAVGTGTKVTEGRAISIIGGSDGPTSIFLAGKVGDDNSLFLIGAGVVMVLAAALIFFIRRKK